MTHPHNPDSAIALACAVLETEAQAITALQARIDNHFVEACQYLMNCQGRTVVIGMGKSGHIGSKIAATLASTGCPAFFVHPGEAQHGDMGMITQNDVVIAISNSGTTDEICTLLPLIKRLNVPLIALIGNPNSPIGEAADVVLDVSVEKEACPLGLAPTASTTAALAMGDALAVTFLDQRGFTANDFALSHPSGRLGRQLLLRTSNLMHSGDDIPKVSPETKLSDALIEITRKKLGMTAICDKHDRLLGIFTDGDLRRAMDKSLDVHTTTIESVMTAHCKTISKETLAIDALNLMQSHQITSLVVTDNQTLIGVIHLHDLLRAGVI